MKVCFLRAPAKIESNPLEFGEVPTPELRPGELLIRVDVCGVCGTDLHVVEGKLPPNKTPHIPGHQAVGQVAASGIGADRLSIGWQPSPERAEKRRGSRRRGASDKILSGRVQP